MQLNYKDIIIVDPCYIKSVKDGSGKFRFDALKHVKTLHDGDDGEYPITYTDADGEQTTEWLDVDSGRIWMMQADFGCIVEVDNDCIVGKITDAREGK